MWSILPASGSTEQNEKRWRLSYKQKEDSQEIDNGPNHCMCFDKTEFLGLPN